MSAEHHLDLPGISNPDARKRKVRSLHQVWDGARGPLALGARTTLSTAATMGDLASTPYHPVDGANYPKGHLGDAMRDTARLIKGRLGVEVVSIDHGSWDMHNNVGSVGIVGPGNMSGMLTELASALGAFFTDLGSLAGKVTVVTITEFGRRVTQNGSGGLDHGWGNAMLLIGAGVRGGYHGQWPGLDDTVLADGDLQVTTDYRSVLSEVVVKRFGVSTSRVFPGFTPENIGVMA
jgi:uncharacterized protein (DUF1501 family)